MNGGVRGVVLAGIDSLVVGFGVNGFLVGKEDWGRLAKGKAEAGKELFGKGRSAVAWYGQPFSVGARGVSGYEYVLGNADLTVCIAVGARGGSVLPELHVRFSSAFLWRVGYVEGFRVTRSWLNTWAVLGSDKVSRADLCADVAMGLPEIGMGWEMLCRGRWRGKHSEEPTVEVSRWKDGRRDTGYQVGKGAMMARIYDKREELLKSGKHWFEDLWKYATEKWLTVREPSGDRNRSRWPLKPWWKTVQSAGSSFGMPTGITRVRQSRAEYKALVRQARGTMMTAGALVLATMKDEGLAFKHLWAAFQA